MTWVVCRIDNNYEIRNEYPHEIRKRSDKFIVNELISVTGYVYYIMSGEECFKHHIIATQWIYNPNNYLNVEHINGNRRDNHLENLRWIYEIESGVMSGERIDDDKVEMSWEVCELDNNYEISSEYPHPIRKISNHRIVSEWNNGNGYLRCYMSGRKYYKHRIIATQWLDNPDNLEFVDHINRNRSDNRIENLRFVSCEENNKNKSSHKDIEYEWIEDNDLPDDLIEVSDYGKHEFEDYYYSPSMDRFMFWNGIRTRLLHINYNRGGNANVCMMNKNNVNVNVYYSKFKRQHNIRSID